MADGPMSTDFESWFADLTAEVTTERRALIRPWFVSLHAQHGAVTSDIVSATWVLERLEVAELAVALMLSDVQRTTAWQAAVELSSGDDGRSVGSAIRSLDHGSASRVGVGRVHVPVSVVVEAPGQAKGLDRCDLVVELLIGHDHCTLERPLIP